MPQIFLHIGLHKTGTTAIQVFAGKYRARLRRSGLIYPEGKHIRDNHVELHLATMHTSRMSPFKMNSGIEVDNDYRNLTRQHVHGLIARCDAPQMLFSAEGLCLLRHSDELVALLDLLPDSEVRIICYIRHRDDWRESYAAQIAAHAPIADPRPDSYAYVADDSWLLDFDRRIDSFRQVFGEANVQVLDYDACVARDGNVIPSFLEAIGRLDLFKPRHWTGMRANQRH